MPDPLVQTQDTEIDAAILSGNCQDLRAIFDQAFWRSQKINLSWNHLKPALLHEDRDMVRLLVTWGAQAQVRDLAALKAENPEAYPRYANLLRRCGHLLPTEDQLTEALPAKGQERGQLIKAWAVAVAKEIVAELRLENPQPGQLMPDGTIYLGKYTPKDRDGNSLSQTFNVFAAPEDLGGTATYLDTVEKISKFKNWHGYNGAKYATDKELYKALKNGTYNGEWIIPTQDILHGKDVDGNATFADNMQRHINTGAFAGTYITSSGGSVYPYWYWSCTEHRDYPDFVWDVRLSDGDVNCFHKDNNRLSCRPLRLVPVPG